MGAVSGRDAGLQSPSAAATAFANGSVAAGDLNDRTAISDFSRALKLRPRFVDAYIQRAQAEYQRHPHIGTGTGSLATTAGGIDGPSRQAIDQATTDLERAHDEGSTSGTLFANLAADLTERGLLEHNNSYLAQSHSYGEQALDKLHDQQNVAALLADTYFILAEDDLAQGNRAASEEYRAAEAQLRNPGVNPEFTVAGALTDLSLMETERPGLTAKIDPLKEQIVAQGETFYSKGKPYETTPAGNQPSPGFTSRTVQLGSIKAEPDPGHALYVINHPGSFDPAHDVLSAQWEYQDPLHGEWAVLPQISGPVTPGGLLSLARATRPTTPPTCRIPARPRVCPPAITACSCSLTVTWLGQPPPPATGRACTPSSSARLTAQCRPGGLEAVPSLGAVRTATPRRTTAPGRSS